MNSRQSRDGVAERAVLRATQALLHIEGPADARDIAVALVEELGGDVVDATDDPTDVVPVDVSFGTGLPLLAKAHNGVARMQLERFLPGFVEDGTRVIALVQANDRLAVAADIDPLTGLANRRATGRALGRTKQGDVVVLLDLDHFKQLNDTRGHDEGDQVLREFGATLRDEIRQRDHAGRHGGEEFLVVLTGATVDDAQALCDRLAAAWASRRPQTVTFSAGIAPVRAGTTTVSAADRAMYRAKDLGRDQAQVAIEEDYA